MMPQYKLRRLTYAGVLFATAYSSLPAYINSSFLRQFLSEEMIGWLYALISLFSIALMLLLPRLLERFGSRRTLLGLAVLSLFSLPPLIRFSWQAPEAGPTWLIILPLFAFGLYLILGYLVRHTLDVYLENISTDNQTGSIRGIFLTFANLTWLISPWLAISLFNFGHYGLVYAVAGLLFAPLLLIIVFGLQEIERPKLKQPRQTIYAGLKKLWANHSAKTVAIRHILVIDFLLNLFYAVMIVYMPLYLHDYVGLPWSEIGLIFTIMLLPFVLFELPLGKIADRWLGEREILLGGLMISIISTIACAFLFSDQWWTWAIILFLTRTGAATVEIMKETYLFKQIDGLDLDIISLSRINPPLSFLVSAVIVSLVLALVDFRYIFLILGLGLIFGLKPAWSLKDTN